MLHLAPGSLVLLISEGVSTSAALESLGMVLKCWCPCLVLYNPMETWGQGRASACWEPPGDANKLPGLRTTVLHNCLLNLKGSPIPMKVVPGSRTDQQGPTHQSLLKGFSVMGGGEGGEKCWLLRD